MSINILRFFKVMIAKSALLLFPPLDDKSYSYFVISCASQLDSSEKLVSCEKKS